jgi:hypothetical protein
VDWIVDGHHADDAQDDRARGMVSRPRGRSGTAWIEDGDGGAGARHGDAGGGARGAARAVALAEARGEEEEAVAPAQRT